ncbi:MAG: hypothetical protein ACK4S4_15805 [Pyrinomonadaceae bacterium]
MALTDTEKAYLAEMLRIPHPDLVSSELTEITLSQETLLKADIARWQVIRGTYGSLNGRGGGGVVFDPADERSAIRKRVIAMLDCLEVVNAYARNGGNRIMRG